MLNYAGSSLPGPLSLTDLFFFWLVLINDRSLEAERFIALNGELPS